MNKRNCKAYLKLKPSLLAPDATALSIRPHRVIYINWKNEVSDHDVKRKYLKAHLATVLLVKI